MLKSVELSLGQPPTALAGEADSSFTLFFQRKMGKSYIYSPTPSTIKKKKKVTTNLKWEDEQNLLMEELDVSITSFLVVDVFQIVIYDCKFFLFSGDDLRNLKALCH